MAESFQCRFSSRARACDCPFWIREARHVHSWIRSPRGPGGCRTGSLVVGRAQCVRALARERGRRHLRAGDQRRCRQLLALRLLGTAAAGVLRAGLSTARVLLPGSGCLLHAAPGVLRLWLLRSALLLLPSGLRPSSRVASLARRLLSPRPLRPEWVGKGAGLQTSYTRCAKTNAHEPVFRRPFTERPPRRRSRH